eukprot:CAMPEP_0175065554 /NCGR_PEP_ID=MMETSP0052_2-20121109/15995_1 /TAXON_ID=51329 ORGANISM="Polytomella parva, Strain SAG 63-3" /NCGR_SAMPLE_ID=MMETSP0052_2 /ASSEMBLY_ACC=CAM_ASM_000194 /LENGTH=59 /DNA_ID=CAMNT_0016332113 /DNA_START=1183 /DNA_END=1362 /DNA_ORIENTATION=-
MGSVLHKRNSFFAAVVLPAAVTFDFVGQKLTDCCHLDSVHTQNDGDDDGGFYDDGGYDH